MSSKNTNSNIDYSLIFIVLLLAIVSCFTLYTLGNYLPEKYSNTNFMLQQIKWYIVGSMAIVVIMFIDYDRLRQVVWILYGIGIILLTMLFFHFPPGIAKEVNGAWGWFNIPGLGTMQPAEFMKIFLIIALAQILVSHEERFKNRTNKSDIWLLAKIMIISLPPMGLIAVQPDLGSFLVLAFITFCMILVSGIRWRVILTLVGFSIIMVGTVVLLYVYNPEVVDNFTEDFGFEHVESRFQGWLDPYEYGKSGGYQLIRAMMSIGSGQLFGKGIQGFEVPNIPERHTDMIFTAIAEQFGFIGASFVITLLFLLIYRLIHIALRSNDQFGSFLVSGMIGMFTFQIFQNIGMSVQLLPITGLPLPFVSYGGSSILTYLIAIGIVLNINYRTKEYMFD
ncbi:rod shape-determining protein RodA [Aquibacillus halophilus]|uniref:Rod shape-determining protein RodA n=1 Tax=Aquibacillus halophilus TaxID=930132 RepID=A0A6A8DI35_9BACI|nr:FtsW/RodA/SpoVE family cell cycle protein [Aquibacillus halophilus]MRH43401.1 rod shape-determining protein RodA [Aquibacillus halophilus]